MISFKTLLKCEDTISNHTWGSFFLLYSCVLFKTTPSRNKGKASRIKFYVFQKGYICSSTFGDLVFAVVYAHIQDKGKIKASGLNQSLSKHCVRLVPKYWLSLLDTIFWLADKISSQCYQEKNKGPDSLRSFCATCHAAFNIILDWA